MHIHVYSSNYNTRIEKVAYTVLEVKTLITAIYSEVNFFSQASGCLGYLPFLRGHLSQK